ncbi:methyl-accepting chemotaxis protein [Anaerolineales bacterium HSG6]|nr:methyl-accepting chemotaxis protein [Anaerolineales bacterium HSG6]MDM8530985.1 methyl-accepting chemotaxis protein [Anaerolineales bacterium HSG25]
MTLNLRAKLLLSFAFIVFLLGGVNLYAITQMNTLADLTTSIYSHPLQVTRAVISAHVGMIKIHRTMKNVALANNEAEIENAQVKVDELENEVLDELAIVDEWILGAEGKQLIAETIQQFKNWKQIRDEVISLKVAGDSEQAAAITKGKGADHIALLDFEMIALRDYAKEKATGMYNDAEATRSNSVWISSAILMLVIVISAITALYVANNITKPVQAVAEAATQLANGDLKQSVTVSNNDEIGTMATAFNKMAASLRQLIEAERDSKAYLENTVNDYLTFVSSVTDGNLTSRLSVNGNDDSLTLLGHNLNQMVERLGDMTHQIREATASISSASAEILAATTQQAAGANEQSAAINQTTATISEVKTIVEQAYQKAQNVAQKARQTGNISRTGQDAVIETVEGMDQIKEKVSGIAENILALSEQTQQIGEITATVNDIASQSNLLALNASVEAARAGEHGKGFAVVAVEVRNLAEQSKQATAQVKAILGEIQQATNAAVMATEEGSKGVDSGVQLTQEAGNTISELAGSIEESANLADQIVASAQQQTTGMEQISLAMGNINQATMQGLSSTRQTERSAQDLSSVSQQLEGLVAQYKLN